MKKIVSLLLSAVLTVACIAAVLTVGYIAITSSEMYVWYTADAVEVTESGSPYKFYYGKLGNLEKHAYNEIITSIYDMPEKIEVPAIDASQLDRVFSAILMDNPDLFFLGRKCTLTSEMLRTYCAPEYIITREEYLLQLEEVEQVKQKIISSLSDPDDEWQTELEIHDYIIDSCTYELSENQLVCSSVYGALVNGRAACEGYSRAAKLMFDEVGIESALVSGVSVSEDGTESLHMWNAVDIDDDFYYLDCTWDDPVGDDGAEIRSYAYFNLTAKMLSETHSEFSYNFICNETDGNYFVRTGRLFDDYKSSYKKRLAEMITEDIGRNCVTQIRFSNKRAYKAAIDELVDNGGIYRVLQLSAGISENGYSKNSIKCSRNDEMYILTFIPERG